MTQSQKVQINEIEKEVGADTIKRICEIFNINYEAEEIQIQTPIVQSLDFKPGKNSTITNSDGTKFNATSANGHPCHYPIKPGKAICDYFVGD